MTTKVHITNQDDERTIEVIFSDLDREHGTRTIGQSQEIKPGYSSTFYVHLLRDLVVREIKPGERLLNDSH